MDHQLPANCPFDLDRHGQYQTAAGLILYNSNSGGPYTYGVLTVYLGIGTQVLAESIDYFDPRPIPYVDWYEAQVLTTHCAGLATIDSPNSVDRLYYKALQPPSTVRDVGQVMTGYYVHYPQEAGYCIG